ncbi:sulfotransferase [Marinimicrobium locisalis]|uniref:sulfotransferase n=1 Tax=Marinimicrobium locisalis TaxID=546022 RepID=UPI0032220F67
MAWLTLGVQLARTLPDAGWRHALWRLPLFTLAWLVLGLLAVSHGLGFVLDDWLFRGYRKVLVRAPVFIVGVPRSGTTYLQRRLAEDPAFTSLTLWECLLAPSISERYFWSFVGRLFSPLKRFVPRWRWAAMDRVHTLGWQEPEEDFLLLLWRGACFLPALVCPRAEGYWRLAFFDQAVAKDERRALTAYYYACLQRHLYFHGRHKRLLSKNPSFTPWVDSLRERFPGARFIACARRPEEAIASQLSALRPVLALLGRRAADRELSERMLTILHGYYGRLRRWRRDSDVLSLPLPQLARMQETDWQRLYAFMEQPLPPAGALTLYPRRPDARPGHRYSLEEYGLSRARVRHFFADVWPDAEAWV